MKLKAKALLLSSFISFSGLSGANYPNSVLLAIPYNPIACETSSSPVVCAQNMMIEYNKFNNLYSSILLPEFLATSSLASLAMSGGKPDGLLSGAASEAAEAALLHLQQTELADTIVISSDNEANTFSAQEMHTKKIRKLMSRVGDINSVIVLTISNKNKAKIAKLKSQFALEGNGETK